MFDEKICPTIFNKVPREAQKDAKWRWSHDEQASFNHLKEIASSNTVLTHFNQAYPTVLIVDAGELVTESGVHIHWAQENIFHADEFFKTSLKKVILLFIYSAGAVDSSWKLHKE